MDDILALVVRAQAGDREAFGLLYDQYVGDVYRFLRNKALHTEEAQDLTSITFMKALRALGTFSPRRETSFRAWLFTLARHSFLDRVRSAHRADVALDDVPEPASTDSPAHHAEHALLTREVARALATLSEAQRDVLVLRVWHDCSFAEIARILGKSEAATKMQMKRALVALRNLLPPSLLLFFLSYVSS